MARLEHDRFVQMHHENDDESLLLHGRLSPIRRVQSIAKIAKLQTYFAAKMAGQKYLQRDHAYEGKVKHEFGDRLQWMHLQRK